MYSALERVSSRMQSFKVNIITGRQKSTRITNKIQESSEEGETKHFYWGILSMAIST